MWGKGKKKQTKIQPNNRKRNMRLALAFLASAFTAAAAGIWIWRIRKSKTLEDVSSGAAGEVEAKKTYTAGTDGMSVNRCAECGYRTSGVQNSMTVHPYAGSAHNRKKRARRHVGSRRKRTFAAVAAVLALAMVSGSVMQYISPASKVMARESFGGIKQIVQEHNEDNPFVILDIVPGKAVYNVGGVDYDFSLGTIGYFVNGQAPIGQDLKRIFTGEGNSVFYVYGDRQNLVEQVLAGDSITGVSYQEGYGGTGEELSAGQGWIKIFDTVPGTEEASAAEETETGTVTGSVPTGRLYAHVEALDAAAGDGSHAGYDYELKSGNIDVFRKNNVLNLGDGVVYVADEQGGYHVIFGNPAEAVSGYRVRVVSADWRNYSDATGVYQWDGSAYHYVSTVKELKENLGEEEGDGEEEEPDADASEEEDKKDDPADKDDGNSGDDNTGDNGDGDNSGDDNTGDNGGGTGDDNTGDNGDGGGTGDGDNTGDNGDGGSTGDGGNTDDSGNSGDNTGDNGDGGNTGDGGNIDDSGNSGDNTGDNGDGGNTDDSGNSGDNTGDNGDDGNSGADNTDNAGGDGGQNGSVNDNSSMPSGSEAGSAESSVSVSAAAVRKGSGAAFVWYYCIEPGVSDSEDTDGSGDNGDNSGSTGNDGNSSNNGGSTGDDGNSSNNGDSTGDNGGSTGSDGNSGNNGGSTGSDGNSGNNGGSTGDGGNSGESGGSTGDGGNSGNNGGSTGDGGNSGESGGSTGDGDNSSNTGNNGGAGDNENPDNSTGDSDGNDADAQPVEGEVGAYYILTFEYVSELEEAEVLYQVVNQSPIDTTEGVSRPIDSYSVLGMVDSDAADQKLSAAEAEENNVAAIFTYVGSGNGTYKLTRDRQAEKQSGDEEKQADAVAEGEAYYVEVQNAPVYIRCSGGNDWLKRYVFNSLSKQDNQYSDFSIKVNTVTAGEVTYEMIQDADLVYLEDGSGLYLNGGVVKKYIGTVQSGDGEENNGDSALGDITETAIARLLYETVEELKPVIVDYGIVTNAQDYPGTHYQKLAKAFLKKDLASFYDEMSKSDNLAQSVLMNVDKESSEYPNKKDNNYHYVNRNVYIVNGSALVSSDFPDEMGRNEAKAGFAEVLAAIRAENTTLSEEDKISEKISKAKAVQYIINYSVGLIGDYKDLTILELQPTANANSDLKCDTNSDRDSTVLFWKREDQGGAGQQILRSSKKIDAYITTKSVVEFNGEYQDINEQYDMIFIGLDGQNLYRERNKDGDLETVYNDGDLNGKVYHTGDRVAYGDSRYDPNDITLQKKEALLDYLRAGYPIVVENDCFKGKSAKNAEVQDINTHYIADNTQMYEFLKEAITLNRSEDNEEGAGIYTIEDVHSSAMFIAQLNTVRPQIELYQDGSSENTDDMIETQRTPEGDYRGTVGYRIFSDRRGEDKSYPGELVKHFYLDLNYDGVFAPEEEQYGYQDEGGSNGQISIDFKEVCFGIVPWKLEIADRGNGYRRDSIQGYFTIYGKDRATVRVLQVLDDLGTGDPSKDRNNLQVQYEEVTNSLLRHYLRGAETLLNMEFKIETVTPAMLEQRLAKNQAYLSGQDVVVLGFGDSGYPGDAVAAAVNSYIASGGGVLVSSAGAEAGKNKLGIATQYLGQSEGATYAALGINSGEKHRYKGLDSRMFNPTAGLYAENINEGTISRWPYQVGNLMTLGEITELKAPEYLLDIGGAYQEGQTNATAWYTLNQLEAVGKYNAYNISPRDARNNYYAYSKGNVVYIGQSAYPYNFEGSAPSGKETGTAETMLFVNALMSAYINSVHPAQMSIVAGFSASATKIESIAVPFDQEFREMADSATSILDDTVDVYFKYVDNNLAPDKTRQIVFCYEDQAGVVPAPGDDSVMVTPFTSQIWTVENNQLIEVGADQLEPGKIYRIKAPVVALKQNDGIVNARIYIAVQVDFSKSGQSMSVVGADSVSLNRAQLFLLE